MDATFQDITALSGLAALVVKVRVLRTGRTPLARCSRAHPRSRCGPTSPCRIRRPTPPARRADGPSEVPVGNPTCCGLRSEFIRGRCTGSAGIRCRTRDGARGTRTQECFKVHIYQCLTRHSHRKPWKPGERRLPENVGSKKPYRGGIRSTSALPKPRRATAITAGPPTSRSRTWAVRFRVQRRTGGRPEARAARRGPGQRARVACASDRRARDPGERGPRAPRTRGPGVLQPPDRSRDSSEREQFATANGYYPTALHELGHATGHPARMDRDTLKSGVGNFGSTEYAREELRAEMSAMMTGERVG